MSTYFPFLRGKQNELLALKMLASTIAGSHAIVPIVEPVNGNATTKGSVEKFVEERMPFVFIVNPRHGQYVGYEQALYQDLCENDLLSEYDNYIPALHINRGTRVQEVASFTERYDQLFRAIIYEAVPADQAVRDLCLQDGLVYHHVVLEGKIPTDFINQIPITRRVLVRDNFVSRARNSDYPAEVEHFTDRNTTAGNPDNINWGDYSIIGDKYTEGGGAALAVAIHHIHKAEDSGALQISHFLSEQQQTTANVSGKVIQAVRNLTNNLDGLIPNDTCACNIYRDMANSQTSRGLGYLKRLAILQHLEAIIANE